MKTIKLKLYQFAELDDQAKNKAIEKLYDINLFYDWYKFNFDDFITICETIGISVDKKKIYFRGFYSQGDGSSFQATVNLAELLNGIKGENWKTYAPNLDLDLAMPGIDRRLQRSIQENKFGCYGEITQPSRSYDVSASMETDIPNNGHDYSQIENELDKLEDWLIEVAQTLNHHLYISLRDEYDYKTSEQAIIETIEANGWSFTADGKLATRIVELAENEQETN